jgi:hypothetical protein
MLSEASFETDLAVLLRMRASGKEPKRDRMTGRRTLTGPHFSLPP